MSIKSNAGAKLIQVAEENDLHQCVKTPTRCTESCQNILDLLFTNQPLSVNNVLMIQGFSDHDAITASIRMKAQFLRQNPRKIFLFSTGDYTKMGEDVIFFKEIHGDKPRKSLIGTELVSVHGCVPWVNERKYSE